MEVKAQQLSVTLGGRPVVDGLSFEVTAGEFLVIIGPSGAGKSTTLKALAGLVPYSGSISVDGVEVRTIDRKSLARKVAVLRPDEPIEVELTVEEVVLMGRSPHRGLFEGDSEEDRRKAQESLELAEASHLSTRYFSELSSGERQRVLLARALAQAPRVLILDEPTSHLDVGHQLSILSKIRALGLTVIAVLHDLDLAYSMATRGVLLSQGKAERSGSLDQVFDPAALSLVFRVDAEVVATRNGRSALVFHGST